MTKNKRLIYGLKRKMNKILKETFGYHITRVRNDKCLFTNVPRPSTLQAEKIFGDKSIKVIEIGVEKGINAESIFKELNVDKFFAVDPYPAELEIKKRLGKFGDRVILIKGFSEDVAQKLKEKVDFVYIDGDHAYESVKRDLELYWSKIKKGGIFSGHDINLGGVSRALIEFCSEKKLVPRISRTDWWIIKK